MSFEASSRVEDPVYGSVGIISQLQEQIIEAQSELVKTKSEIAFHNAQQQLQQQQMQQLQMINAIAQEGEDWPSSFSSSQQDPFSNVNQQLFEDYNYSDTFCGFEFWANYNFSLSTSDVKNTTNHLDIRILCHWGGSN